MATSQTTPRHDADYTDDTVPSQIPAGARTDESAQSIANRYGILTYDAIREYDQQERVSKYISVVTTRS